MDGQSAVRTQVVKPGAVEGTAGVFLEKKFFQADRRMV
jgi:hypothetical protein